MPNFKSDLITAKDQVSVSAKQIDGDRTGGIVLFAQAKITLAGTETVADTMQLCDIPPGCILDPDKSNVVCQDPGTTLTLDIGYAANPDGMADGIVLSAGGKIEFVSTGMPADALTPFRTTEQTRIYATVMSANTLTAGAILVFNVAYRCKA